MFKNMHHTPQEISVNRKKINTRIQDIDIELLHEFNFYILENSQQFTKLIKDKKF